jgi:hypothetical protein
MSWSWGFFRGPGISFSLCNTIKKRGPNLKRLGKGKLGALSKNPVENLEISGWLLKRQGGVRISGFSCGIISYDIVTNDGLGKRHMYERPRRSPRVTGLVRSNFGTFV